MGQSLTARRTLSRDTAFKLIYEREIGGDGGLTSITELMELNLNDLDMDYINAAVDGAFAHVEEIDQAISDHLHGWTLKRLAKVDLSIMRLALFEMKYMADVATATSINEALELSHTYSTEKAAPLINGVLGAIGRELEA